MPPIGTGDAREPCRGRLRAADWGAAPHYDEETSDLGRRHAVRRRAAKGVYAYVQPDGGWMVNNSGVIVDGSGTAVLVDTMSTEQRNRAVLDEVAQVSTGAPRAVVNTHHHPDHTYGNGFLPAETLVIGHEKCRERCWRPASRPPR